MDRARRVKDVPKIRTVVRYARWAFLEKMMWKGFNARLYLPSAESGEVSSEVWSGHDLQGSQ